MTILLALLILLNLATVVAVWQLHRRIARIADASSAVDERERRARWIREMEIKERWTALDLDRLHPVNRDEVAALLRRVDGASPRVLTRREREFLDRMVEAERRAAERPRASSSRTPDTRRAVTGP